MDIQDVQMLLASTNFYDGAIDGIAGPKTMAGVEVTERGSPDDRRARWSKRRRLIAAGQEILNAQGFEAGKVDGYAGHNTKEALIAWKSDRVGTSASVEREKAPSAPSGPSAMDIPRQRDCPAFYGRPGTSEVRNQIVRVDLPFKMRLDWNLRQSVTRMSVHKKCAPFLTAALEEVLEHYGYGAIQELGLDRFAGSYVERRMRGGSSWSMHSYGCAIDIYAAPNGLRTRCPDALFCGSEYKAFLDIMESHGWLPAIRLWGADAMHFQMATL